jgi:hypothetical protein
MSSEKGAVWVGMGDSFVTDIIHIIHLPFESGTADRHAQVPEQLLNAGADSSPLWQVKAVQKSRTGQRLAPSR